MCSNKPFTRLALLALVAIGYAVLPTSASAALQMRLSTGSGATVTLTDEVAGDGTLGTVGLLSNSAPFTLGNFTVQRTDVTSKPLINGMHLHNLSITSTVADTLLIETVDDSFGP